MGDATEFGIGMLVEPNGGVRLRPQGELDLYTAPRLERAVLEQLDRGELQVVVDLSRTSFIDSSGLGAFVKLSKAVAARGGHLRLTSPVPQVARVFEITGVHQVIDISLEPEG